MVNVEKLHSPKEYRQFIECNPFMEFNCFLMLFVSCLNAQPYIKFLTIPTIPTNS